MEIIISVITPVYNSSKYLKNNIGSVMNQSYKYYEHILIDDCSSDNSIEIVESYAVQDPRIKLIKLEKNSGAGVARNVGIHASKGRFIAFLDSDDLWCHEKLEIQIQFMRTYKASFTFTGYECINETGDKTGVVKRYGGKELGYERALLNNPIGCLTVMYDTEYFGKIYMPVIRKRQDYALWLKLLKKSKALYIDKNLSYYRIRKDSISSDKLKLIKYQWVLYREIEGLSFCKSLYCLTTSILFKVIK